MINSKKVLALIPARSGSKGLPGKNVKPLLGKPLIAWPVEAALQSKYVDDVIITTDCEKIAHIGKKFGASAPWLRPEYLANDSSNRIDVINHAIENLTPYDILVYLEPTSPLTDAYDIDNALDLLVNNSMNATSIVGVSESGCAHPDYSLKYDNGLIKPYLINKFSDLKINRQELSDSFYFDGTLYISFVSALAKHGEFYHDFTMPYLSPKWKSFEIDDIYDFKIVESILKNKSIFEGS
jgi:CMP-N,N'-diacetyllegionaminic acid synthase